MTFIRRNITQQQLERARNLYDFHNIRNSIMSGAGELFGAVGEILVRDIFEFDNLDTRSTRNFDLKINSRRVDVKTSKGYSHPHNSNNCKIPETQTKQDTDFYFFTHILHDFSAFYLLGYISKRRFFEDALFRKKGEIEPDGFRFRCNCYTIKVGQLQGFTKIRPRPRAGTQLFFNFF